MAEQEYVRIAAAAGVAALDYPGVAAPRSGILDGDRFWPGRTAEGLDGRRLVLTVGCNGDPAVLAGKLRRAGATGPVPMVRAEVTGLGIGHSAHVSRGGYLPAAPYASTALTPTTVTVALWLTDEQRAAVDATEPNYNRVRLRADDYPIGLEAGRTPKTYGVYVSRWGVVAVDGVRPVPLGSQEALHARLADVPALADLAPWRDPEAAVAALADDALRDHVRQALADAGWVADAGL
jgi:hypothetical protein